MTWPPAICWPCRRAGSASDTFSATQNLMLREVFRILSRLTGIKAPSIKLPRLAILPLAYANQWIANLTGHSPRIPLEGVKMAKYKMHYDCSKAIRELGIPQTRRKWRWKKR